MVVWSGGDSVPLDTGAQYDPVTDTWTPTSTLNAPSQRYSHVAVWTGNQMVVWGGYDGSSNLSTGGRYDPVTDIWTPTSMLAAPTGRRWHSVVWTGNQMVVWGGYRGNGVYLNSGGRYDPVTDTWAPTSLLDAPSGRYLQSAVWTGSLMIVWGGLNPFYTNTGGRYALGHSSDDDGDGFSECAGDCNDTNLATYPGSAEICDGLDNDCDALIDNGFPDGDSDLIPDCRDNCPGTINESQANGDGDAAGDVCDCAPADPGAFAVPVDVSGTTVTEIEDGYRVWWTDQMQSTGGGTVYDVFWGAISALHPGGDFATGSCRWDNQAASFIDDMGPDPPVGGAFYFMIRAQNACPGGTGTYGTSNRDATAALSAAPCD